VNACSGKADSREDSRMGVSKGMQVKKREEMREDRGAPSRYGNGGGQEMNWDEQRGTQKGIPPSPSKKSLKRWGRTENRKFG